MALALGVSLAVTAPPALAETTQSTVSGGSLTVTTSGVVLAGITLDGSTQTTPEAAAGSAWTITDARGTGQAWAVSVTATTPTSAAGSSETVPRTIAVTNLQTTTGTVAAGVDSDPITNLTGSTALPLTNSSQTLISSSGTNKGTYTLTPTFTLTVPANAYRSNYATGSSGALNPYVSTLTYTIA